MSLFHCVRAGDVPAINVSGGVQPFEGTYIQNSAMLIVDSLTCGAPTVVFTKDGIDNTFPRIYYCSNDGIWYLETSEFGQDYYTGGAYNNGFPNISYFEPNNITGPSLDVSTSTKTRFYSRKNANTSYIITKSHLSNIIP